MYWCLCIIIILFRIGSGRPNFGFNPKTINLKPNPYPITSLDPIISHSTKHLNKPTHLPNFPKSTQTLEAHF